MKARVIQNDHLPGTQERTQHYAQPQLEQAAVTSAIKAQWRHQAVRWRRRWRWRWRPCGYYREALAGMTQARVKARHTARTPAMFALQAVVAAAFIPVNPITYRHLCQRRHELRARRFIALLVTPTLFLRVQPKRPSARENDIAVKDTPVCCCQARDISPSVACA